MDRAARWPILIATIGIGLAAVAIFFEYLQANQAGHPGGYAPLLLGTLVVGLLVSVCHYLAAPRPTRSIIRALMVGVTFSVVFMGVFTATLIWRFGS